MTESAGPIPRMSSEARRELVLAAATIVFSERGYSGATTDQVAAAAGVSQPYVVRMFGTKEKLFLAVLHRALGTMLGAFRAALAAHSTSTVSVGTDESLFHSLGDSYSELLRDHGLLLSLMHGFVLGADPEIGRFVRQGFLSVYRFLRDEAGFTLGEAHAFLAEGMLLNTLVGLRMTDDYDVDPDARDLLDEVCGTKIDALRRVGNQA